MKRETIVGLCAWVGLVGVLCSSAHAVTIGISADGRYFTIDGVPTYLNGVSYYGATSITTASFRTSDLDDMVADGFNWIRVWGHWQWPTGTGEDVSVLTYNGQVREPYMTRLKALITECNSRGIIVDVSLNRDGNGDWVGARTQANHLACVQTLATQLLPYRNVYIDVANERDVGDDRYVSLSECGQLIDAIHAIDADRLCTASGVPSSQTDLANFRNVGKLQFITPHLCRSSGCSAQTITTVNTYNTWMTNLGWRIPIHLQEPFRRGYTSYNPVEDDFLRDCNGGKLAGAAGWCLHNGANGTGAPYRSFLMSDAQGRLYAQWDSVEVYVTNELTGHIAGNEMFALRYQPEYDEQMAKQVGRRDGAGRSATVALDATGYLTYGPYLTRLPVGAYQVTWRMLIDNNTADNASIVTLDVYNTDTSQVLASQTVTRQQFASANVYQNFVMSFNYATTGQRLEFRTYWLDTAYLKLDYVDVRPQISNEPVIGEVSPDPDSAKAKIEYQRALTLIQGITPITWSVVSAPAGVVVDGAGLVKGWTPSGSLVGTPQYFEIKAQNSAGFDTESWYVNVIVPDFDNDNDVDLQDFGHLQACYSGSGVAPASGCGDADWDGDNDVDQTDFAKFRECFGGADRMPGC